MNAVVGDLAGNADRAISAIRDADEGNCDVLVFPELFLTGYPPEDLLHKRAFLRAANDAAERVIAATTRCLVVIGAVEEIDDPRLVGSTRDSRASAAGSTPLLANAALVASGGTLHATVRKQLLPTYGVFDEQRWFQPGLDAPKLFHVGNTTLGVVICEDLWADGGPGRALSDAGAHVIVSLNASPFAKGRLAERMAMVERRQRETGCTLCYVNLVGGQDELVFDGGSFAFGPDGLLASSVQFNEVIDVVDLDVGASTLGMDIGQLALPERPERAAHFAEPASDVAQVWNALVLGVHDYFDKNGFNDAVIALSGGVDSSIVAAIAVDALGAQRVHGVMLPSRYSSEGSVTDAVDLANRLGIDCHEIAIEPAHQAFSAMLRTRLGHEPTGLVDENLQSRIRGLTMMGWSNALGDLVLTTGNKSETAVGYSTLYGDTAGAFAVIKDVAKTLVYDLCRYRNDLATSRGETPPIPTSVLEKPPSAELRPDQRDDQSLPPYEILDRIIEAYVEHDLTAPEIEALGFDAETVNKVVGLIDAAEYKRRQSPLGPRITEKAFGRDRRVPITNRFRPRAGA
jgi:NAD+ synthase (glutamine-hydrolysing)